MEVFGSVNRKKLDILGFLSMPFHLLSNVKFLYNRFEDGSTKVRFRATKKDYNSHVLLGMRTCKKEDEWRFFIDANMINTPPPVCGNNNLTRTPPSSSNRAGHLLNHAPCGSR